MKMMMKAGALALLMVAGTAEAAPTPAISFNTTGTATNPVGSTIIQNFDSFTANSQIAPGTYVYNTTTGGTAVRPTVFSTGNYAAVLGNGMYNITFGPTSVLSFALGSLDAYNTLTLAFANGDTVALAGTAIVGGASGRDGVVTYTVSSGSLLTGAQFNTTTNAFEFDNIAVGVPEPAAWGMMILGFGLVGGVLRRRAPAKVKFA